MKVQKLTESFNAEILFIEYESGCHESGIKLCDIALGLVGVVNNSSHKQFAAKVWNMAALNRSFSGQKTIAELKKPL